MRGETLRGEMSRGGGRTLLPSSIVFMIAYSEEDNSGSEPVDENIVMLKVRYYLIIL